MQILSVFKRLGPGLLYAAAAIGVSHLVQSTRAGADFGFGLVWAVLIANILKYPFYEIAPKYVALTNKSLLHGYRQFGRWPIVLFIIISLLTMFIVQAAVTVVTAGIFQQICGVELHVAQISLGILLFCGLLLIWGRYHILDNFIKFIIVILTITTVISLIGAFTTKREFLKPAIDFSFSNNAHLFFFIALVGWMPAPLDVPVWHSLWSVAKNIDSKERTSLKDALVDFNIGYIGTAILAVCFLSLGALVMYRSGESFSGSAAVFAGQLIGMYTKALGSWSYPIIAIAAFTTMFSTTLTCLDAFSRILREAMYELTQKSKYHEPRWYNLWLIVTVIGSTLILFFLMKNMKALVDVATTVSFLVAPFFAIMNYFVMHSSEIPKEYHPKGFMKFISYVGMIFLTGFSLWYLWVRFLS